jgi:hypothetical protein
MSSIPAIASEPGPSEIPTGPDDATIMLAIGAVGVSVVNILCMTVDDGSKTMGVIGMTWGAFLMPWCLMNDSLEGEDRTPYLGIGLGTAIIGACDFVRAKRGRDTQLLGLHVDPSMRSFDNQHWLGLQLSSSW